MVAIRQDASSATFEAPRRSPAPRRRPRPGAEFNPFPGSDKTPSPYPALGGGLTPEQADDRAVPALAGFAGRSPRCVPPA